MQKKLISILLVFIFFVVHVNASEVDLISEKYILYNMNDNSVLMQKDENTKTNIASLTKIMTVIVAIEKIDDYDEKVTITKEMLNGIASDVVTVGFKVGDKVTYNDLLYGAILASGADAVNALAISASGSLTKHVEAMNEKAKELGLENTHFENVVGLYDTNHYSSAYDVAQTLIYALKNKKFKEVFNTNTYTSTNNIKMKSTIERYNSNNSDISYITGSKTGYIAKAGYCLASTATIDGVDYLLVTLNAFNDKNSPQIKDAVKTYKYFSDTYEYKNIVDTYDIVVTLKTKYAKEKEIGIHSNVTEESYLKKTFDKKDLVYDYDGLEEVSYFTKEGTKLGNIKIMYEGEELNSFDLMYNETLTFSIWLLLWDYKFYILGLMLFIVLILLLKKKKRKKHRK